MKNTRTTTLLAGVTILSLLGGGVVLLQKNTPTSSSKVSNEKKVIESVDDPGKVVKESKKYNGKTVIIRGNVIKAENNTYYIVGTTPKPTAIKLDLSKTSVKIDDYADTPLEKNETQFTHVGPFKAKGTYRAPVNKQPTFELSSIEQT
ncbi:MAG: hypothetical protein QFB86_04330 [Patescibacteria group bacterium]|nr:hypothetical protein [Patescibacteria group bacterium]